MENNQVAKTQDKNISSNTKLTSLWNIPQNSMNEALKVSTLYKTTHGMFAGVPLVCKDYNCPYKDVCMVDKQYRIIGQRCIMEAGAIIARFESWCNHFGIDISQGRIKDSDLVDASLIRDLVDNEVQMLRAENRIAISSDFIERVVSTVDTNGKAYYENQVSPEAEFKLQLQEKRYKILNLLNSTRKDKANELKATGHPSVRASSLLKKIGDMIEVDLDKVVVDAEVKEESKEENK